MLHMIETEERDGSVHASSDFAEMADNKEFRTVLPPVREDIYEYLEGVID